MKTTPALVRSVAPDGDAIKKRRLEAKQTQKQLIRGSTVQLRTYQRAEEGKSISRETLGEIARLLKVTFEAIVKDDAEKERGQVKLYNCAGKGGSRIMKLVQGRPGDVRYQFDLDPGPEEAEKIAAIVELCKSHTIEGRGMISGIKSDSAPYLGETSAAFIRAVGTLNAKVKELTDTGVNVFVGSYWYWDTVMEAIVPDVEDEEYVSRPSLCDRVLITFSERNDEFILSEGPRKSELEEVSYERAAGYNYRLGQHPDAVDERLDAYFQFVERDEKFLQFNREYWHRRKALERPSKVVRIATPANGTLVPQREDHEG